MRKTSVYLPDHLKRALTARATATRRSEAEVLRTAVEAEVANRSPASATSASASASANPVPVERPEPGRLVGVGVGPGDPDLLTVRALTALRRADRVLAPATAPDAIGRAETIVRQAAPDVRVERAPFVMHPDPAARAEAMADIAAGVADHLDNGDEVAFITLGDPLTYSTFSAVADAVRERRPDTVVEVVPGIMAFQSLAARTGTTLVDERQRLSVRTAVDGDDLSGDLAEELADPTRTIVLYKGGRRLPDLAEAAESSDRLDGAVAGELLGMTGERIGPLAELATGPASYLATVILPATRGGAPTAPARRAAPAQPAKSPAPKPKSSTTPSPRRPVPSPRAAGQVAPSAPAKRATSARQPHSDSARTAKSVPTRQRRSSKSS